MSFSREKRIKRQRQIFDNLAKYVHRPTVKPKMIKTQNSIITPIRGKAEGEVKDASKEAGNSRNTLIRSR